MFNRILPKTLIAVGLAAVLAGLTVTWQAIRSGRAPAEPAGESKGTGRLPEFALARHDGGVLRRADLEGRWTLLFFGFTHCPAICPTALATLAEALRLLERGTGAPLPQVVFVSVDPKRDTPALLAEYVTAFNPEFVGATGSDDALFPLVRVLGVAYERHESGGAHYNVDHTASAYLIGPDAALAAVIPPEADAASVARIVSERCAIQRAG